MAYEPATNTTTSEGTRYWLEKACAAAKREGVAILGFIVIDSGPDLVCEAFASVPAKAEDFVDLIVRAAVRLKEDNEN
jgi:hypothetical protein